MKAKLSILDAALLAVLATVTLNVSGAEPAEKVEQVVKMTLGRAIALADSGKDLIHILDSKGERPLAVSGRQTTRRLGPSQWQRPVHARQGRQGGYAGQASRLAILIPGDQRNSRMPTAQRTVRS